MSERHHHFVYKISQTRNFEKWCERCCCVPHRSHSTDTKCMPFSSEMNLFLSVAAAVVFVGGSNGMVRHKQQKIADNFAGISTAHFVRPRKCIISKFYRINEHHHAYFIVFLWRTVRTKHTHTHTPTPELTAAYIAMRVLMRILWMRIVVCWRRHHV